MGARPPSSKRLFWKPLRCGGGAMDCPAIGGAGGCSGKVIGGAYLGCEAEACKGGWRVRLGRAVRQEQERCLWLGEGPGQTGSLHLRYVLSWAGTRDPKVKFNKSSAMVPTSRERGGTVGLHSIYLCTSHARASNHLLLRIITLLCPETSEKPLRPWRASSMCRKPEDCKRRRHCLEQEAVPVL